MDRRTMSETLAAFRNPTSARQAAEKLGITKQAVLGRLKTLRAFGTIFGIVFKRIATKGPEAKLLFLKKAPRL